jgi:hypothetical protein
MDGTKTKQNSIMQTKEWMDVYDSAAALLILWIYDKDN